MDFYEEEDRSADDRLWELHAVSERTAPLTSLTGGTLLECDFGDRFLRCSRRRRLIILDCSKIASVSRILKRQSDDTVPEEGDEVTHISNGLGDEFAH